MSAERGGASQEGQPIAPVRSVLLVEQGGRGGVADYTDCLAAALAERGLQVILATAQDNRYQVRDGIDIEPVFAYVRGRSRAAALARRAGLGRLLNGLRFLASLPPLFRLARRHRLVHVQGWERTSLGVIATTVLLTAQARIVYTAHNTFERRRWALDSSRIFPALARATIVHTAADARQLGRPATIIPHGHYGLLAERAAVISPRAARQMIGLPEDAPVVLLFGHLRPDKGLDDLLGALLHAPGWHGLVAGEDDGALSLVEAQLRDPRLAGRVIVEEGFHELDAVGRYFAAADLVVLPYAKASQSGVLHLAYGFGLPVIAYPVGGIPEAVLDGETGWICEEPNAAALAAALRASSEQGQQEMRRRGRAAQTWARQAFGWDAIAVATLKVYEDVAQ